MRFIDEFTIYKEVEYINKALKSKKKGVTLMSIANEYGFDSKEEFISKLSEYGYNKARVKSTAQFIKGDVGQVVRQTVTSSYIKPLGHVEVIGQPKSQGVTELEIKEKYNGLFDKYDVLMKMVEAYEMTGSQNVTGDMLIIELPHEVKTDTRATFRINDTVYNQFKEYAETHKQFTVKELVSKALMDLMKNYK